MKKYHLYMIISVLALMLMITTIATAQEGGSDTQVMVDTEASTDTMSNKQPEDTAPQTVQAESVAGIELTIWSEGFESVTFPPTGWGQTSLVGTYTWDRVTSGSNPTIAPHSGTAMARWNAYSILAGNQTRLWTSAFSLGVLTNPALEFFMSHDTNYPAPPYDRVTVQISTNGGTIWSDLGTIDRYDATCTTPCWRQHSFNLSAYVGQTVQIGFVGISQYGNNFFVDDVAVTADGPDMSTSYKSAPTKVLKDTAMTYAVHIINTGNHDAGSATMTDPIPAGATYVPGSVQCSDGTCSLVGSAIEWSGTISISESVTITFQVTAIANCGVNIVNTAVISDSQLIQPVVRQATTQVVLFMPLLQEGFENATFPPTGWGQVIVNDTGADPIWTRETAGTNPSISPHSGAAMTKFNSYTASALGSARLYTPALNLSTAAPPLQFWMSHDTVYSTPPYDRVTVQASTDGGTNWTDLGTIDRYDATCATPCWKLHSFTLASYLGQPNVRIGFLGISQYGDNFFIDDVLVGDPWAPCPNVTLNPDQSGSACHGNTVDYELTATNITPYTETYGLSSSFTWPTMVFPTSLNIASMGSDTATVSVYIPWAAEAGDSDTTIVTATGQTNGLTDQALLNTTATLVSGYTDYADVPSTHRTRDHSVVYYNDKLYDIGGWDGAASARLNIFDISANTWMTGTSMTAPRYWIDCVAITGKIYCAGGYSTVAENTLYIYDIATDIWSTGATLPVARYAYSGVALGGKYYVIGGYTTSYQNTMIVYDPVANTWDSTRASMSVARRYAAAGVIGNQIYVAGGLSGSSILTNSTEVYNSMTNTWSPRASLPMSGWVRGADGVMHDRYLVWAGGYAADSTASSYALAYDSVNNSWAFQPYMSHLLYSSEGDVDGNGNFWIVSGRLYEGIWGYSRYTTRLIECAACTPLSGVDFTFEPINPVVGMPTIFTASVTAGSPAITYSWNFGDSGTGNGETITHTFASAGTYTVTLTASNCDGANSITVSHTVVVNPVIVEFNYLDLEDVIHNGEAVYVAGSFNGWNNTATQLTPNVDFSIFTAEVNITTLGSIKYEYVVFTDTLHSGPANLNWLQSNNRTASISGGTSLTDYRNIEPGWYTLQRPQTFTVPVSVASPNIFGQIGAGDLTARPGPARALLAQVGYGTSPDPATWTTWQAMVWGSQVGINDELVGSLTFPITGTFYYAVRYSANFGVGNPNDEWIYADLNGGAFNIADAGLATVISRRDVYLPLIFKVAGGTP